MMRIQKTKEGTFLIVETDSEGQTFCFDEKDTFLEAMETVVQWEDWEDAWEDGEDKEEQVLDKSVDL